MRIPAYRPIEGTTAYVIGTTVAAPQPLFAYMTVADVLREETLYGRPEQSATAIDEIDTVVLDLTMPSLSPPLLDAMPSASVEARVILSEREEEFDIHSIRNDQLR